MILDVERLTRTLVPHLAETPLSVAFVRTTRPKYLVFGECATTPEAVVQFGPGSELQSVHRTLDALEPALDGLVPKSLACRPWRDGQWVNVQSGLEGVPWFAVQRLLRSPGAWSDLLDRAGLALRRLRGAVAAIPAFTRRLSPADELLGEMRRYTSSGLTFTEAVERRLASDEVMFRTLGVVDAAAQHGDFGINNLLVSRSDGGLRIIDFDEFGATYMPLQDEIGLGLSIYLLRGMAEAGAWHETVRTAVSFAVSTQPTLAPALAAFVRFHLLWRLNRCSGSPTRAQLAATLRTLLEDEYFSNVAW